MHMNIVKYIKNSVRPPVKSDIFSAFVRGSQRTCGEVFLHSRSKTALYIDLILGLVYIMMGIAITATITYFMVTFAQSHMPVDILRLPTQALYYSVILTVCFLLTVECIINQTKLFAYLVLFVSGQWDFRSRSSNSKP
jgi:hypothetical protein